MSLSAMENCGIGATKSKRELPPAHFSLTIQGYSLLPKAEKYDSGVFEVDVHKWRLSLHPNEKEAGTGYISLYLAIAETDSYPEGWEVYADYKFFVLDQTRKKYLTVQDADGEMKRFYKGKIEFGFEKLITIEAFKNSSNGYLVNDRCEFGAEVFVYRRNSERESLEMIKKPSEGTFRREIDFPPKTLSYYSKVSTVGERNWKIRADLKWPNAAGPPKKDYGISVFLLLDDWRSLPPKEGNICKLQAPDIKSSQW